MTPHYETVIPARAGLGTGRLYIGFVPAAGDRATSLDSRFRGKDERPMRGFRTRHPPKP
jgi:hypothetical protein